MAWRIDKQVVRLEVDNRRKGRVTGRVWLIGRDEPVRLDLQGNAWRDLAGCVLKLVNPHPVPASLEGLATDQQGVCGDLTASQKVKVPTVDVRDWLEHHRGEPLPYHWGNAVYLEWFSTANGRVVIQIADGEVHVTEPEWRLSSEEEKEQRQRNAEAMEGFLQPPPSAMGDIASELEGDVDGAEGDELDEVTEAEVTRRLEQIDRIEDLKKQVQEKAGGEMLAGGSDQPVPLDLQEQFWQNVADFEDLPRSTLRKLLIDDGIHIPPPEDLTDEDITKHLWQVIRGLAARQTFLEDTNHLSDRELYTLLVRRVLEQETEVPPSGSGWNCHLPMYEVGGLHGEESDEIYLRYYADEATREEWASDALAGELPVSEKPPYDRDRQLPQSEGTSPE